jgi:Uncharacterized C-terminal domain of topoisomerase IA
MPKDAYKNIGRYKMAGGDLNPEEFRENQEALAESSSDEAQLIPGTPPEQNAAQEVEEAAAVVPADTPAPAQRGARKRTSKKAARTTSNKAAKKTTKRAAAKKAVKKAAKKTAAKKRPSSKKAAKKTASKKRAGKKASSGKKRGAARKSSGKKSRKTARKR